MKDTDFERKITINQNKNKMNTIKWLEIAEGFNKCIESALEINRQRKEQIIELIDKRQKETIKENKMEEKSNVNTQTLISKEQLREWIEKSAGDIIQEKLDNNKPVSDFQSDLRKLINRHSKENGSDTPDFILAEYLNNCLDNFNNTIRKRESRND